MNHRNRTLSLLGAAALLAFSTAVRAQEAIQLKVGSIWATAGAASSLGLAAAQGVRLAVAEINKDGFGVGGQAVQAASRRADPGRLA